MNHSWSVLDSIMNHSFVNISWILDELIRIIHESFMNQSWPSHESLWINHESFMNQPWIITEPSLNQTRTTHGPIVDRSGAGSVVGGRRLAATEVPEKIRGQAGDLRWRSDVVPPPSPVPSRLFVLGAFLCLFLSTSLSLSRSLSLFLSISLSLSP